MLLAEIATPFLILLAILAIVAIEDMIQNAREESTGADVDVRFKVGERRERDIPPQAADRSSHTPRVQCQYCDSRVPDATHCSSCGAPL